ncbi:hypothetical protein [Variovorax gossypii]
MPYYRVAGIGMVHMRGRGLPEPCHEQILVDGKPEVCAVASDYLCDGTGKASKTCDRPLCEAHATRVGRNRHLCPACRLAAADAERQMGLFTHLVR